MRKIYLVKKNPELPVNGNNWIVMNGFEFMKFIQTPEGRERRKCFGQLDACSVDDVIIIAECGIETAKKWRSEKDSHDYLEAAKKKFGVVVFSYNAQTTAENELSGEELLVDKQCDVAEEVLRRIQKANVQKSLSSLSSEEKDLIYFYCPPIHTWALLSGILRDSSFDEIRFCGLRIRKMALHV